MFSKSGGTAAGTHGDRSGSSAGTGAAAPGKSVSVVADSDYYAPRKEGGARRRQQNRGGGEKKTANVTLKDIFGTSAYNGVSAPVIQMHDMFMSSPDSSFLDASDYVEFSFSGELDTQSTSRGTESRASVASRSVGSGASSASAVSPQPSRRTWGPSLTRKNKRKAGSASAAGQPFVASTSSFDAVFVKQGDEFEMDSPFVSELANDVKDAAAKILYSQTETLEEKARKLFLLDQLNKPAPPVVPPKLMATEWSTSTAPSGVRGHAPGVGVKKKRGVVRAYDPNATALGVRGGASGFYSLVSVAQNADLQLGWRLRIELLRDISEMLMRLHESYKTHNSLDDASACLVSVDSFRGAIADEKSTVVPISKNEDPEVKGRIMRDVLCFGAVVLAVSLRSSIESACPDFHKKLLSKEKDCSTKTHFEQIDASHSDVVLDCDRQVREALAKASAPGSLLELCAQCCSGDRLSRPSMRDAWDWLDSILSDFDKASGYKELAPEDVFESCAAAAKKLNSKLKIVLKPKLADMVSSASADYDSGYDSDASRVTGASGYASDDSFQPPPAEKSPSKASESSSSNETEMAEKRKSKLSDFLSSAPAVPARPMSLNLSSGTGKLADFVASTSSAKTTDATVAAGIEAHGAERTRRRSEDLGYIWAKQRFARSDAPTERPKTLLRAQKAATENVGKFQEAWKVAQGTSKARKSDELKDLFLSQTRVSQEEALAIVNKAEAVMKVEKSMVELKPPVVVVGDIHGQFFDLVNMMKLAGPPGPKSNKTRTVYVFLGDYVDRGDFSCEVLLYLLSLKGEYPDSIYLLRGNHECRTVSSYFGFKEECEVKYGLTVFNKCMQAFQAMPIAALLETQSGRFLCCHGGISPNITSLAQFAEYNRFIEPGMNGFLCDLLWSDPVKDAHEDGTDMTLGDFLSIDYLPNPARGCSYRYGFRALVSFLAVNKLVAIIRAHEVQMSGYRFHFQDLTGGKSKTAHTVMPPVVTVFSAPNYCEKYGNKGAFLKIHAHPPFNASKKDKLNRNKGAGGKPIELLEPVQFEEVPHPPKMFFRNEQREQTTLISQACPYMPTTFHAFLKRATELAQREEDEAAMELDRERARASIAPVSLSTPKSDRSSKTLDVDMTAEEKALAHAQRPKSLGDKLLKSVASVTKMKITESSEEVKAKADLASKKNWKALQQLGLDHPEEVPHGKKFIKASERQAADRFEEASEADGINEMNPMLISEKVELAKQRIQDQKMDGANEVTVVLQDVLDSNGQPVLSRTGSAPTLVKRNGTITEKKRADVRIGTLTDANKRKSQRASQRLALPTSESSPVSSNLEPVGETKSAANQDEVSFNSKELLALQMLFLFLDRSNTGFVTAEDLIAWSQEEGFAVPMEEANICLNVVDLDGDSKIGFSDYLGFAARSKDAWLVTQYSDVVSAVRDMRMQPPPGFD